jgi:hypothetical protein
MKESEEDNAWREAGRRRFESAYAPEDSVYEELIHDFPSMQGASDDHV